MSLQKSVSSIDLESLKRTKALCDGIANNPEQHSDVEREAAVMVAGQMRHWIFEHESDAPAGDSSTAQVAKRRLDGLKVENTPKIEDLILERQALAEIASGQQALLEEIAAHLKQSKLPKSVQAKILAVTSKGSNAASKSVGSQAA